MRFSEFNDFWLPTTLSSICSFRKKRKSSIKKFYVSTENILQNYKGIEQYNSNEVISGDEFLIGDILMANIRPYLKKVYMAEFDGVSNSDVLIFKSDIVDPHFLHCILANDNFINYVMNSVKGSKMPRGDKIHIMNYHLSIPRTKEQEKIAKFIDLLDQRIDTQSKIIEKYESLIKVINQMMCNFDHEKIQVQNVFDFKEKTKHQANMGNSQGNFIYFTNEESTYKYFDSYDFDGEYIIANTGGKANFKYYNGKFAVMSDCLVMECNDNQNTKFYLYSILNRIDYINQVCFVGSGLKHLDKKLFFKTFITKFNKNLEPFINLIILLEKKISNDKILLQKLKEQKKYLLSNMFI